MSTILYRFLVRAGLAAAVQANNEVVLDRELEFETDTRNFKMGNGVDTYDALPYFLPPFGVAAGTNAVTVTFASPPVLFDGALFNVRAANANTAAVSFNPNGLGALDLTKLGNTALVAGDIAAAGHELLIRYRASPARYELMNPATASGVTPPGTDAGSSIDGSYNLTITPSRASGAETIALKTQAGTDATADDGITISFRDAAANTGGYVTRTLTAAISLVINSGATLGADKSATATVTIASPGVVTYASHRKRPDDAFVFTTSGALPTGITAGTTYYVSATGFTFDSFQFSATVGGASINTSGSQSGTHTLTWKPAPFRAWLVAADDGGTVRLGVIKCAKGDGSIYPLRDNQITSSTAIGAGSDSAGVIYSGTAWTSKSTRVLGYLEYTLPVAGTWDTAPTFVQVWSKGQGLPGDTLQDVWSDVPTGVSGTTTVPFDSTVPQSSEGDQYFSLTMVAGSLCNLVDLSFDAQVENTNAGGNNVVAFFLKDAEVNALNVAPWLVQQGARPFAVAVRHRMPVPTVSSMALKVRIGGNGAGTTRINTTNSGGVTYGGCFGAAFRATEIMT